MRRKKLIVLASVIFILSLTVIFSNAEQDKRRRITNSSHRDIFSLKNKFRARRVGYNQQPRPFLFTDNQQRYIFPSRNNQKRYVPGEILVNIKKPLSDFEVAYLFGKYQSQKKAGLNSNWAILKRSANNVYRIRIPENCSVEQMVQFFERNPYVVYAEPNHIVHITAMPDKQDVYHIFD